MTRDQNFLFPSISFVSKTNTKMFKFWLYDLVWIVTNISLPCFDEGVIQFTLWSP